MAVDTNLGGQSQQQAQIDATTIASSTSHTGVWNTEPWGQTASHDLLGIAAEGSTAPFAPDPNAHQQAVQMQDSTSIGSQAPAPMPGSANSVGLSNTAPPFQAPAATAAAALRRPPEARCGRGAHRPSRESISRTSEFAVGTRRLGSVLVVLCRS